MSSLKVRFISCIIRKEKIHLIKGVIFEFLVRLGFNNGRERLEAKIGLTIEHLTGGYGHIPVLKILILTSSLVKWLV